MSLVPNDHVERARRVDLRWVAESAGLKLKRATAHERVGPSPRVGGVDGFSVNAHKSLWRDRKVGVGGSDAISLYAHIHGLDLKDRTAFREVVEALTGENIKQAPPPPSPAENKAARDQKIRDALGIWQASGDPNHIVKTYLRSRDLLVTDDIAGSVIRWHERGAMVCLMRNVLTGEPQAIHQTLLDAQGRKREITLNGADKATCRLFKGPTGSAAVMFDAPGAELFVGEGVETVLSGRQHYGQMPAWAMGSSGEIGKLPLVARAKALSIHRELLKDGSGPCPANRDAAEACGRRWKAAGRKVSCIWPVGGKDLNDAIRSAA